MHVTVTYEIDPTDRKLPEGWEWHRYSLHGISTRWIYHRATHLWVCTSSDCGYQTKNVHALAGHNRGHRDPEQESA